MCRCTHNIVVIIIMVPSQLAIFKTKQNSEHFRFHLGLDFLSDCTKKTTGVSSEAPVEQYPSYSKIFKPNLKILKSFVRSSFYKHLSCLIKIVSL